jgi:hypothetical protein
MAIKGDLTELAGTYVASNAGCGRATESTESLRHPGWTV